VHLCPCTCLSMHACVLGLMHCADVPCAGAFVWVLRWFAGGYLQGSLATPGVAPLLGLPSHAACGLGAWLGFTHKPLGCTFRPPAHAHITSAALCLLTCASCLWPLLCTHAQAGLQARTRAQGLPGGAHGRSRSRGAAVAERGAATLATSQGIPSRLASAREADWCDALLLLRARGACAICCRCKPGLLRPEEQRGLQDEPLRHPWLMLRSGAGRLCPTPIFCLGLATVPCPGLPPCSIHAQGFA